MIEHLNLKGKLDSREGSIFLVLRQNLNPPHLNPPRGVFEAQKIVKNRF
jgi:hypothetical protein